MLIESSFDAAVCTFDRVEFMAAKKLRGEVRVPPDKSISHRALFLNVLSEGDACIKNLLEGADTWSSIRCLQQLGVRILHEENSRVIVTGVGNGCLRESDDILDVGLSATTMRFIMGLAAAELLATVVTGSARTRQRPMLRVVDPLRRMGATIVGRDAGERAPLAVLGRDLTGIEVNSEVSSGEVKTALLMAGLKAKHGSTSIRTPFVCRDHTERMLRCMGGEVDVDDGGRRVAVSPLVRPLQPLDMVIPGDISVAVYWIVLGLVHSDSELVIKDVGVNPTRTALLDVLRRMSADLEVCERPSGGGEPIADIRVRSSRLKGTVVEAEEVPRMVDEFPGFALAASLADGETFVRGAGDLRNKKSDRITRVVAEYKKLGAIAFEEENGMRFKGVPHLLGANCSSHADHRLANSLAVAGLVARGVTSVDDVACITRISYPDFWKDVIRVCGKNVIVNMCNY